jgi:hypothetical protein
MVTRIKMAVYKADLAGMRLPVFLCALYNFVVKVGI